MKITLNKKEPDGSISQIEISPSQINDFCIDRPYDCNWSKFDLKKHKERYTNYLEVIIHKDGMVEYAHPSHMEKLITIYMNQNGIKTRDEVCDAIDNDCSGLDAIDWLIKKTGCVVVWTEFYIGNPNEEQLKVLKEFVSEGVCLFKV